MTSHKRTETVVAEILNSSAIPCVLSGPGLHALFGAKHDRLGLAIRTIDFVVPDHLKEQAVDALVQSDSFFTGFYHCSYPSSCWQTTNQKTMRLQPSAHLHADIEDKQERNDRVIQIFKQSSLMWTLPSMDQGLLPANPVDHKEFNKALPPYYTLASDASMPTVPEDLWVSFGSFTVDEYPVVVPKAYVLLELRFHAYARYVNETYTSEAYQSIYLLQEVIEYGLIEMNEALLPSPVRKLFNDSSRRNYHNFRRREWDSALMAALGYPQVIDKDDWY